MSPAILHTHVLVVILFLILFLVKAILLFMNKHDLLKKVRKGTKALDMIFGVLILISGGYLLFQYSGIAAWLWVKVVLVLVAISLGIVGIKRNNKILTALTLLIFFYVYAIAETKSLSLNDTENYIAEEETPAVLPTPLPDKTTAPLSTSVNTPVTDEAVNKMGGGSGHDILEMMDETQLSNAKAIYDQKCAFCHGTDGRKQNGGAPDLTKSNLNTEQHKTIIANGKGLMPGFKNQFTDQEIEALAAYSESL